MTDMLKALAKLDPSNDDHWTADGAPRIEVVENYLEAKTSRKEIIAAAPTFTREIAAADVQPTVQPEPEAAATPAEPEAPEAPAVAVEADPLAELQARLDAANAAAAAIEKEKAAAQAAIDAAIEAQAKTPTHISNQLEIQRFLQAQQEQRIARGEARRNLAEAGVDLRGLQEIVSGSKLDQAMSRKKGFGNKRPVFTPGA